MAKRKRLKTPKCTTLIGADTRIRGDVEFSGGLYVNGTILGNVCAEAGSRAALTLDQEGSVQGEVRAPVVVLNGSVVGDVYASEHAELLPLASVTGTLYYRSLEMALGAEVNGQLVHTEDFAAIDRQRADEPLPPPASG